MTPGIGKVTPGSDEGQAFAAPSPQDQTQTHGAILPQDAAERKAVATRKRFEYLRALLALHGGHVVHQLAEGGFLVCWRSWSRECRDLDELEAHARRVGAM